MKNKILTMSRDQLRVAKNNISMSNASREKKTELYEMIDQREKDLNLGDAIVVKSDFQV